MKKTLLTIIAALLLGGVAIAQNHWDAPDSHAKSSNTPIVANVTIDGQPVTLTADYRLGAFVGDELRGLAAPYTEEEGNFDDSNFWIQVFYDYAPNTSEDITFKLYDGTTEYASCGVTKATQEEGWGTPSEPVVLDFVTTQTQSTTLAEGWSWWSTPIEMNGVDGLTLLENSLGTVGVRIQSLSDGRVDYYDVQGGIWYGTLNTIYNEQMYKINTSTDITSELRGQYANPSTHPITIGNSWNWIGFPYNQAVSINVAMSGFTPNSLDQIKSFGDGYATYYVTTNFTGWYGTLTMLQPGKGYMYYSSSEDSKTLVYQTSRGESVAENLTPKNNVFKPNEASFADNMTVTAVVEVEGEELRNDNYEVAAFVGNECRGSVKLMYVEPLNRYIAFLLISGDTEENLRFALTDGNDISWSNDYLKYNTNAIIGNLSEPAVLHFGPLGLDNNTDNLVNVYPNPSKGVFNIEGDGIRKVEIVNSYGQVVYSKETMKDNMQIDLSRYAIGVYMLRVITNNGISTKQLIKE